MMRVMAPFFVAVALVVAPVSAGQQPATQAPLRSPDVIFVPTPPEVVAAMLKVAKVGKGDIVYDLGSGDGRIPITAARKYGIKATGIDIDPERIREANESAAASASMIFMRKLCPTLIAAKPRRRTGWR